MGSEVPFADVTWLCYSGQFTYSLVPQFPHQQMGVIVLTTQSCWEDEQNHLKKGFFRAEAGTVRCPRREPSSWLGAQALPRY